MQSRGRESLRDNEGRKTFLNCCKHCNNISALKLKVWPCQRPLLCQVDLPKQRLVCFTALKHTLKQCDGTHFNILQMVASVMLLLSCLGFMTT